MKNTLCLGQSAVSNFDLFVIIGNKKQSLSVALSEDIFSTQYKVKEPKKIHKLR